MDIFWNYTISFKIINTFYLLIKKAPPIIALHFLILQAAAGIVPGEVLSTNQLMEVCHWMRSHFHHFCVKKIYQISSLNQTDT